MSLLDRLRRLATWADPEPENRRAMTPPQYQYGEMRKGISDTRNQPTADQLVTDGFQSTQAIAARAIANRVGDLELIVTIDRKDVGGRLVAEEADNHALRATLDYPNPLLSRRQLLKLTSYWLTQSGEAFWLIVTNGAGKPVELWPLSPAYTEKLSSDTSPVSGFVFHGDGGETHYGLDEVVWMFDPDPSDPFTGVGVVGPQARDFDAMNFGSATLRSHFQKDATPKTVITAQTEADAPNQEQREAFWADWQNRYNSRSGENLGVPAFLPSGFDMKELSGMSDIGAIQSFLAFQRDNLLMANGVPRSILGDVVDANRAAAETNQFVFDRHTIKPQAGLIADALTFQLARPTYGPRTSVAFSDFVSADEDLRLREEDQDVRLKVRSINQVREDRGVDPVDWGELPVGSFADIPYTGDEPEEPEEKAPTPDPEEPDDGAGGSEPESIPEEASEASEAEPGRSFVVPRASKRIAARFAPELEWQRTIRRDAVFLPRMTSAMRKVFAGQKGLIIAALPDLLEQGIGRAHSRADFVDALFEGLEFSRLFRVLVDPVRNSAVQTSAENALDALEQRPALSFDIAAKARMDEIGADLVSKANETTKRSLRRTLAEGIDAGDNLAQMTKRVRTVMNRASKGRARVIARTEIKHAVSWGQVEGYELSEVVARKEWRTALDQKVRDFELGDNTSHRIDGQTVDVSSTFTLGDGEKARAPGVAEDGGRLSAHNGINCRCFTLPVVEGL